MRVDIRALRREAKKIENRGYRDRRHKRHADEVENRREAITLDHRLRTDQRVLTSA